MKVDELGKDASGNEKQELKQQTVAIKLPKFTKSWFDQVQASAKLINKLQPASAGSIQPVERRQE